MKKRPVGAELLHNADGQTDTMNLTADFFFSQFWERVW